MSTRQEMSFINSFSRRNFIVGASAFAAFSMEFWSGGCEGCLKQIKNRPTRRNIREPDRERSYCHNLQSRSRRDEGVADE